VRGSIILDTGPLVAFLDRRESHHNQVVKEFKSLAFPLYTCEPVITETCFIMKRLPLALEQLGSWIDNGIIRINFSMENHSAKIFSLIKKYADLPMSLADACLVSMFEESQESKVFTLDGHFQIYRTSSRRVIKTIGLEP
jgi:predicted nucleic acid-binding protein